MKKLKDESSLLLKGKLNLNFDCIKCPVCEGIFECPSVIKIQNLIDKYKILYIRVKKMIEQRIEYESIKVNNNEDKFILFIFHICSICHQPYYAGKNNNYSHNNKQIIDEEKEEEEKDCFCGIHSFVADALGVNSCEKHKSSYIEYKCKFCCNIASRYNPQSKTHFCENCYFNNPKNIIKNCNKVICPFKGNHEPNGKEFCLGCYICRYESVKNPPKL